MARRTKPVTITAEGRDQGKTFLITEMDAVTGEKWAMRLINAAMKSGAGLGDIDPAAGMAGLSGLGLLAVTAIARMPWDLAEPLLDEMMACVRPMAADQSFARDRLVPDDTEEIATRIQLREEVASLHLGFSLAERFRSWMLETLSLISSTTPPSPGSSAQSSTEEKPAGAS